MTRQKQPVPAAMPQGASMRQTSSAPSRSTSALQPLSTVRFVIVAGTIALGLGSVVAFSVARRGPIAEHRRRSAARSKARRARQREWSASMAREVSMVWWRRRLEHSTTDGAEPHDNAWRGTCTRCGDRMGTVHECRDLAR